MPNYTYRFRIYPNKSQQELIQKTFGCCRFVYNHFLQVRKEAWDTEKRTVHYTECCRQLTLLKKELGYLAEVDSHALVYSLRYLDNAFQNFIFQPIPGKKFGYPKFKSKKESTQSYRTQNADNGLRFDGKKFHLPKIGFVKCRVSKKVNGRIVNTTVVQSASGKYYVYIGCADVEIAKVEKTGASVGIDMGVKQIAILSDGRSYENHKFLYLAEKRLARLNRSVSRKSRDSKNREKARIKAARLYERISNQRRDFLHKTSIDIVRRYDDICVEDLKSKDMQKSRIYAKCVTDASFYTFRRQLEYKCEWYGKTLHKVPTYYPSSQVCSNCGCINKNLRNGAIRKWICPQCGMSHDRDINAAVNILNEGLRQLA